MSVRRKKLEQALSIEEITSPRTSIERVQKEIVELQAQLDAASKESQQIMSQIYEWNGKLSESQTIGHNFAILRRQYQSDVRRIGFIVEGAASTLPVRKKVKCPVCGEETERTYDTYTTISRNDASENFPFLTWGNESVDAILNAISCKIPKDGPIQRISVQHNGVERISYLVASVSGPMLIKSVSDLDGLQITPNGFLTAPDIAAAKQTLAEFLDSEQDQVLLAKKSEQENQKYAGLQEALVQKVAKQILQQEEDCGNSKYSDAMRHLEETRRQIRHVSLPVDIFFNKQMQLIFPLAEQSGAVFVSAQGFLLDCALEYSERIASTIKIKKSEITTAMVLSRLT